MPALELVPSGNSAFQFPGLSEGNFPLPLVTFLGVLIAHSQMGIEFVVRNFNTIEPAMGPFQDHPKMGMDIPRMSVTLDAYIPASLPQYSKLNCWTKEVNLSRILPERAMAILRMNGVSGRERLLVGPQGFLVSAQVIADVLNREIKITHQWGGNMEYAGYTYYQPFVPGGDGRIEEIRSVDPLM